MNNPMITPIIMRNKKLIFLLCVFSFSTMLFVLRQRN
jgi:hypothetical protein